MADVGGGRRRRQRPVVIGHDIDQIDDAPVARAFRPPADSHLLRG